MDVITTEEIRAKSKVVFAEYDFAKPEDEEPDPLEDLRLEAIAEFHGVMGTRDLTIPLAEIDTDTTAGEILATLINKAIRMWTEFLAAVHGSPEIVDTASTFDLLSSQSAGPVSESRRNVGANKTVLHPWPQLDKILSYIVKLWTESISAEDVPPDVPVIESGETLPKPGEWYMDRYQHSPGVSVYGQIPYPGVPRHPHEV